MLLGFTGPIFSPQGACASGNHAIGIGARMIRDGDCDFVLAGGVDTCLIPEIIHGFANMKATIKITPKDRAFADPTQASRPFSIDRKGFVLSEGGGRPRPRGRGDARAATAWQPKAEVMGVGWTSDAHHFTAPEPADDHPRDPRGDRRRGARAGRHRYINAHGTSTPKGDKVEVDCLREVFGPKLPGIPVSSNKSQIGHTLGAAAAIEAALGIEGMRQGIILPTINHIPDPELADIDVVPNDARRQPLRVLPVQRLRVRRHQLLHRVPGGVR